VTRTVVEYLAGLGHRRLARVGGIPRYWHSKLRADAFARSAAESGLEAVLVECDYTGEHGADATRALLAGSRPPTAILYDNDLMALAGLAAAQQIGVSIPADLSVVAWDDSVLCKLVHPAVTALRRDIAASGAEAARRLAMLAGGAAVGHFQEPPPVLTERGSTGPAARPAKRREPATPHVPA